MNNEKPDEENSASAKKERSFDLYLPAIVTGLDAAGREFAEKTDVRTISSQEATFPLKARLMIGSKIRLALDVPRTLILEKPLRLHLSGSIALVRSEDSLGNRQYLSASLDRAYRLFSDS